MAKIQLKKRTTNCRFENKTGDLQQTNYNNDIPKYLQHHLEVNLEHQEQKRIFGRHMEVSLQNLLAQQHQ